MSSLDDTIEERGLADRFDAAGSNFQGFQFVGSESAFRMESTE